MNMKYQSPQITICKVSVQDIIATSLQVANADDVVFGANWSDLPDA